jgi:hypothetical protein
VVLERLQALESPSVAAGTALAPPLGSPSPAKNRTALIAVGVAAALAGLAGAVALAGGDEPSARPEAGSSASPESAARTTVAPGPSARAKVVSRSDERSDRAVEDAGVTVEPKGAPTAAPTSTAAKKSNTKRKTQSTDSDKKKKGPGGIYIPPPSEWF